MSTFFRKNLVFGVSSTLGFLVGHTLWRLSGWLTPLKGLLPHSLAAEAPVAAGGLAFLAGAAVFVALYVFLNARLEEMW